MDTSGMTLEQLLVAYTRERALIEIAVKFGVEGALSGTHSAQLEDLETAIQLKGRAYVKAALARAEARLETFKTRSTRRKEAQEEVQKLRDSLK